MSTPPEIVFAIAGYCCASRPSAATLRDALATALWSQNHPGVDERLDDGTTDIDTLDAFEYTIERDYRRLTAR